MTLAYLKSVEEFDFQFMYTKVCYFTIHNIPEVKF